MKNVNWKENRILKCVGTPALLFTITMICAILFEWALVVTGSGLGQVQSLNMPPPGYEGSHDLSIYTLLFLEKVVGPIGILGFLTFLPSIYLAVRRKYRLDSFDRAVLVSNIFFGVVMGGSAVLVYLYYFG